MHAIQKKQPQPVLTVLPDEDSDGRYVVHEDGIRLGLVLGGNRTFVAETMRGKHIGRANTIMGAALLVHKNSKKK